MSWFRFRAAVPVALLVMVSSMVFSDAPGADDSKRPARRQAAGSEVGAPRRQAAGKSVGAPKRRAASRGSAAAAQAARAAATRATTSPADSGTTAVRDSSGAAPAAAPHDSATGHAAAQGGKGAAGRDTTAQKPDRDEPRDEAPVHGPRLPVWPGISLANPSAGHDMVAAAR